MMNNKLILGKFSLGMGDRFGLQAQAQLRACMMAEARGMALTPVWNKSNREHLVVGSEPSAVRSAADAAVKALDWKHRYHVDADHIRLETVDRFIPHSDFFTIDVADSINKPAPANQIEAFLDRHPELIGTIEIPGIEQPFQMTRSEIQHMANKYLLAVEDAGKICRHIAAAKGEGNFITEISMDETDRPQTPIELLVILTAIADAEIPVQTIAPKFTGRFNKGVDYVGDVAQFEQEFCDDLAVIRFAVLNYELPKNLKLSVHSGSDKFSIYAPIRRGLARFDAGIHIKTAGTTWLEEVISLAEAGGDGLLMAKQIYSGALDHLEELCAPYATVIDIDRKQLPSKQIVSAWGPEQFASALRHDPACELYNPHLRQLLHVGYKIAAKMGARYPGALKHYEKYVARNVTQNLFQRHIKPLFLDQTLQQQPATRVATGRLIAAP